ncbi:MAG: tyrosine-protein phosphatase [Gammaproteobacteria bacterium]|nr:tyrosine-protein phosphatase [Gammaproteobacteria bacterium]
MRKHQVIHDFDDRHHKFEGCFNFRDIGGYEGDDGRKVRWGRYYRAGRQDRMTERDLQRLRDMGIRTQIDLRRSDEIDMQGRGPLVELGADYCWHPVMPDDGSEHLDRTVGMKGISGERYLGYLTFDPAPWKGFFEVVANADRHPLVIHCTAGKDRTGVTTALVLSILGVERNVIEADYALTNRERERQVDFLESTMGLPEGHTRESLLHATGVPEDAISVFLDGLEERHGGPSRIPRQHWRRSPYATGHPRGFAGTVETFLRPHSIARSGF